VFPVGGEGGGEGLYLVNRSCEEEEVKEERKTRIIEGGEEEEVILGLSSCQY